MPIVSARAYAKHRCVSHTAVQKAIAAGYLKKALVFKNKKTLINSRIADAEWIPVKAKTTENTYLCPVCGHERLK